MWDMKLAHRDMYLAKRCGETGTTDSFSSWGVTECASIPDPINTG